MHDRAARPTGAIKSAAAIAIEIMILLNIDLRIAQVRPCVEKSVQRLPALTCVPASHSRSEIMITIKITRMTCCTLLALCNGSLVNRKSFRDCDQYVSCNCGEQGESFVTRKP